MRIRINFILLIYFAILSNLMIGQSVRQTAVFRGSAIRVPGASVSYQDNDPIASWYFTPKYDNVLTFEVDRNAGNTVPFYQNTSWIAQVEVVLLCYTSATLYTKVNKTYTLHFDASKPDAYNLPRISEVITEPAPYMNKIELYVNSLTVIPSAPLPQLDSAFSLSMSYKRSGVLKPNFQTAFSAIPSTSIRAGVFELGGLTNIFGTQPFDELDVEWTFVDANSSFHAANISALNGTSTTWSSKYLNFSRVTVPYGHNNLKLPAIYNDGYIVYRIRQVYYDALKNRLTGPWVEFHNSKLNTKQVLNNHASKLNWISSISFAEEGKHKDVVTYFDGAQRDRQSVTYDNSSNRPIIAETYYDKEGRKSAAILPAPHLTSSEIKYYPNFNVFFNSATRKDEPYDADAYSYLPSCVSNPMKLSVTSGASHYYSPFNILKNDGFNQFIPDAEGYPLTISEYTNDNTGRIRRQTGVGAEFQFDKGHYTEYIYAKPSAEELDRLFGTNVGYSSHYFKNVVLDPNGQQSVTYTDLSGKTIATALEGSATNRSIQDVSHNTGSTEEINLDLVKPSDMKANPSLAKTSGQATINVPFDQVVRFSLGNDQVDVTTANCKESFCNDCYYDIDFMVKDNCGVQVNKFNYKNYNETDVDNEKIDEDCDRFLAPITKWEEISLNKGENYVSVDVKIPSKVIDFYEKKYLESDKCVTELSELIEKHRLKIQPNSCIRSCEECLKYYGNVNQQKSDILKRLEQSGIDINADWEKMAEKEAKDLRKHCDLLCDADNECELKRSALLADVSPGGQYAIKFFKDPNPGFYAIEDNTYILFHLNKSSFKKKSGLAYNFPTVEDLKNKFGNNFPIKAGQVPDIDTLLASWTDEMADYLVQFHPEYCYYEFCRDNRAHFQFIADMQKVEKWSEAVSKGYIVAGTNPLNFGSHIVKNMDPHFKPGALGFPLLPAVEGALRAYDVGPAKFNIFELAVLFTSPEFYDKDKKTFDLGIFADVNNAYCLGQKDVAWLAFRNLYIDVTETFLDLQREAYVGGSGGRCVSSGNIGFCKFNESIKNMSWWMRLALRKNPKTDEQNRYCNKNVRFQSKMMLKADMERSLRAGASGTSTDQEIKKSKDSLRIFCDTNCINMAEGWIQSLSFCDEVKNNVNQAKDKIRAGLIAVCRSSCGEENYSNGAASVSPKDPNAKYLPGTGKFYITLPDGNIVSSFDEVINLYTSSFNRAKCNGLYIDYPEEYHVLPQFEPRKMTTQVDTCSCENLKYERTQFLLNPKGASTLYQYLKEKYPNLYNPALPSEDFNISEEDFDIFVESCRDRKCKYLPKDIEVPYVLECAPKITCDQFNNARLAFEAEFGFNPMKINDAKDQPEFHYKKLWAGYLNKKLGVNANYVEYEKFAILCKDCKNDCFISDFIQDYVTKNGLTWKDLTMADFLDITKAYNTANGTQYTPEQILTMYLSFRRMDCFELTNVFYAQVALPKGGLFNSATKKINTILKSEFDKHFKTKLANDVVEFMFTQCMINNKPIADFRCDKPLFSKPHSPLTEYHPDTTECARKMDSLAVTSALEEYHRERQESVNNFRSEYIAKCLTFANTSISALMRRNEFHYTLYYYGQDGNLLATVPPAGVKPLDPSNASTVAANRIANAVQIPEHMMKTTYEYNSLNQVIAQNTPDGGTSRFLYDQLGRLIVSQNAKQETHSKLSYTIYDRLGRIIESGELELDPSNPLYTSMIGHLDTLPYLPFDQYMEWITQAKPQATLHFVTRTYYDKLAPISTTDLQACFGSIQQNLRHRIASITLDEMDSDRDEKSYSTALHYSYDVLGNVKTLVSENNYAHKSYANQKYKTVQYDYDLVSGKVNKVYYQKDKTDQFIYLYTYDAENRIKNLFSSKDDVVFNQEVQYEYYLHGPLARTIYGEDQVQGIDYAYTLQGWLKGINASTIDAGYDMGRDGDQTLVNNINSKTARDAIALTLQYYRNDYQQIARNSLPVEATMPPAMMSKPLYNGNISSSMVSLSGMNPHGYQYSYDQLNRLIAMDVFKQSRVVANNFNAATIQEDYKERISYDPNGNIQTYFRNMDNANPGSSNMDDLKYNYYYYPAGGGPAMEYDPTAATPAYSPGDRVTNQLASVQDALGAPVLTGKDIGTQNPNNYRYDEVGNLIRDSIEDLHIEWTPTGKIAKIINNNKGQTITFAYDPMGNRIMKEVEENGKIKKTYYTRDAQGNALAIYANAYEEVPAETDGQNPIGPSPNQLYWIETPLYGSSRIGSIMPRLEVANTKAPYPDWIRNYFKGKRQYELTNHLGNVLATIKDEKKQMQFSTGIAIDYYNPIVYTATDYYPFGMPMPNRTYALSSSSYRFGFNGKEKDNEVYGEGNTYAFEARTFDSRIGRWFSHDPREAEYPWQSTYAYYSNSPIATIDYLGEGDFYKKDGSYIGSDGVKDDKLYSAEVLRTREEDGKKVSELSNVILLPMKHSEFQKVASVIRHEAGTSDKDESLWLAHTSNNQAKATKKSLYKLLMSGYSSAPKETKNDPIGTGEKSIKALAARSGVLDVLMGGQDPTGGARFWDGTDFLAWGLQSPYKDSKGNNKAHAKFREYNKITISASIFDDFHYAQSIKYPKGKVSYKGTSYGIPDDVFNSNWVLEIQPSFTYYWQYNTGSSSKQQIEATGSRGRSIFWKVK